MASRVFLFIFALLLPLFSSLTANDAFHIKTLRGSEMTPYIQQMIILCDEIYREYPYLYNGDHAGYQAYLEAYPQEEGAVTCLAFDGDQVVGLAIGLPMVKKEDDYKRPLIDHGYHEKSLFYLGEFGVKPAYRDCGIEEAMYEQIEVFAREEKIFDYICFWEIEGTLPVEGKPLEYLPQKDFWEELGFVRYPELNFELAWTNIGDTEESAHFAVYSIKKIGCRSK